jgi:serpin B
MKSMTWRRSGLGLVAILVAACGSTTPSSPPAGSPALTPVPSIVQPAPSVSPSAAAGLKNTVVVTVSDRLRVRSQPRVSDDSIKYEPVLPIGTELLVLDGPVEGSGYTWYKVAPVSFPGLAGPGFGWVSSADKTGEAWIAPQAGGSDVAMAVVARAAASPADAARAGSSINAFGVNLYRRLVADGDIGSKNLVFSPASIEIALAMARGGAKGDTATQMDRVLQTSGWKELAAGINSLDQALASRNGSWTDGEGKKELTLKLANAPFAQNGWSIEPAYLDALGAAFGAGLRLVDYQANPDGARQTINRWVSDRTAKRIPELLREPDVSSLTRLFLVNAIYLKAQWTTWFNDEVTQPAAFHRSGGSTVSVPTMERHGGQDIPYARGTGWQATELRYLGPDAKHQLAMLLVLPDDLRAFESGFSGDQLAAITASVNKERGLLSQFINCPGVPADQQDAGCYRYDLDLLLPRFGVETRANLKKVLTALGMPRAFETDADFSGIHTGDPLYIGTVIHQANIDVDEKGTEAAAATAVGMDTGGGPSPIKEITLRLDRPFLFFVRDVETGAVLFMGRVTDPSAAKGS